MNETELREIAEVFLADYPTTGEGVDELTAILKDVATRAEKATWISVEERLPDPNSEVRVWFAWDADQGDDAPQGYQADARYKWDTGIRGARTTKHTSWISSWDHSSLEEPDGRITHWMPLPDAPAALNTQEDK